jgi:hypothetical protein
MRLGFVPWLVVHMSGYLFWKRGLRGPVCERYPADSTSPPHPKKFLAKYKLEKHHMEMSMSSLEVLYPSPEIVDEEN